MKTLSFFLFFLSPLFAGLSNGATVPDFSLMNAEGKEVKLSDYKGKTVVLEWVNFGCPFVKKFYSGGDMQSWQSQAKKDGVVWLSINSSAKGKQGYYKGKELTEKLSEVKFAGEQYLVDTDGKVGRKYGAKVTPHMYVINKDGVLVYQGAIDSVRSTKSSDISKATNYVAEALKAISKGSTPKDANTKAYGCSVKYAKK